MKKTSRRSFGKQLAGAVAAIPVVSSMVEAQKQEQEKKPGAQKTQLMFREHDTPPPVIVEQGSCIVEIAETVFDSTAGGSSNPKKYRLHPKQKAKVHLAHVKIVDGSGEILYRNDNIMDSPRDIRIAVTTAGGVMNIGKVGNNFEIETPSAKKLEKTTDALDQPPKHPIYGGRMARFRYRDDTGGQEHHITGVRVTKGASQVLFELSDLTDLPSKGQELRIMVWLEETD